jgi:hypothetical protein
MNNVICYFNNIPLDILSAELSIDEDNSSWSATINLTRDSAGLINLNDAIELHIYDDVFALFIIGKTASHSSNNESYSISCTSQIAQYTTPYSAPINKTGNTLNAKTVVEELLNQPVTWNLPNWYIPSLAFVNAYPLEIAKNIVNAVGGVIESLPDGSLNCRLRHAVNTNNYQVTDHQYDYSEIFSVSEHISYADWFNYVTVSNDIDAITQTNDTLEVEMNNNNSSAIVRAYPEPMRDVQLVHSGDNNTSIIKRGLTYRTVEELIEFKDGKSNTQYNIQNIINTSWQYANLGSLAFIGNQLTASINGYSLLNIQYSVASVDFLVSDTAIEKIQFVLME